MSDAIPVTIPDLDLPDIEVRLSVWHRHEGRYVREGDRLLEMVAGDVAVDLTAPADGHLRRLVVEDDILTVGRVGGDHPTEHVCIEPIRKLPKSSETSEVC